MKNIFLKIFIFTTIISLVFTGCQKEELGINGNSRIIKFKNIEEYQSELTKVLSMDLKQLDEYEISKGYSSVGKSADEFYQGINFEKFKSKDELITFVKQNSKYLQLIEDDGDYYIETLFATDINRYFINKDRMFIIDNTLYKVFENGLAMTDVKNIEQLKRINDKHELTEEDSNIHFSPKNMLNQASKYKDSYYNCGTSATARATKKRDRTKIELSIATLNTYDANNVQMTIYNNRVLIRPYKKTLGVWYWCTRTLSCDIKLAIDYYNYDSSSWDRFFYYKHENGKYASKLEYTIDGGVLSIGFWASLPMHYGGYDCWADSPSTSAANLECNINLF